LNASRLLHLGWLELIRFKRITFFLIFNFTLGLVGFFLLQIFQQSLSSQTAEKAQVLLGGDLRVEARRAFSEAERKDWESKLPFTKKTRFYTLFSMLRTSGDSRLVNVGVFDSNYPLYGKFKIQGEEFSAEKPKVWVDPEVQELLKLQTGQMVDIGEAQFEFAGVIIEDPSRLFRGTGFAPRVLIHENYLEKSQLIKPGSTFTESWLYEIPKAANLAAAKTDLEKIIKDPVVQIETAGDNAQDSNRVLKYFTDYLGLVALVALGLCFLCGSYLLQWTFQTKKKSIAIFKTLGLSDTKILFLYLWQSFLVSVISCVLSILVVRGLLPVVQSLMIEKFNLPIQLEVGASSLLLIALIGVLGPLLMTVPQILQIFELQALQLFQNAQIEVKRSKWYFLWIAISLGLFWLLSIWQSHSVVIASSFVGALIFLVLALGFVNRGLLRFLEKASTRMHWLTRYAIKGLTRRQNSTNLVFITMSLATLVLSLLPHIKSSILYEIKPETISNIPQLFLFDIQPEQVEPLKSVAKDVLKIDLKMRPLVRSRILKINDQPYERAVMSEGFQTREAENEARFRNRGVNLTYAPGLQESETLVKGQFAGKATPNAIPQISLEEKYAERVNVKVGDTMTFDVQGIEMQAQVGSIRQIRWTSFQPNFFILFPTQVLEEAPQIFLTSVQQAEKSLIKTFQNEVVSKFKNVSIIDVSRTIENSLVYIDQMSMGLQFMAWLAVSVGLFVFVILLNTQLRERLQEMNLVQILGAKQDQIQQAVFIQFLILITLSLVAGVLLGLVAAWLLMSYFFKIQTVYDIQYLGYLGLVLLPLVVGTIFMGLRPLKNLNPMDLIRQL
jgi:putative ABC transport system permease protein